MDHGSGPASTPALAVAEPQPWPLLNSAWALLDMRPGPVLHFKLICACQETATAGSELILPRPSSVHTAKGFSRNADTPCCVVASFTHFLCHSNLPLPHPNQFIYVSPTAAGCCVLLSY